VNGAELSNGSWKHLAGLKGEQDQVNEPWTTRLEALHDLSKLFTSDDKSEWYSLDNDNMRPSGKGLSWYRMEFEITEQDIASGPLVIRMNGMQKGAIWLNGNHLGRYWNIVAEETNCFKHNSKFYIVPYSPSNFLVRCGEPTQGFILSCLRYHISHTYHPL
jgi:hypothetical protein